MLILYGDANENHEVAFSGHENFTVVEGTAVRSRVQHDALIINWTVNEARRVIRLGSNFDVYLLGKLASVVRLMLLMME